MLLVDLVLRCACIHLWSQVSVVGCALGYRRLLVILNESFVLVDIFWDLLKLRIASSVIAHFGELLCLRQGLLCLWRQVWTLIHLRKTQVGLWHCISLGELRRLVDGLGNLMLLLIRWLVLHKKLLDQLLVFKGLRLVLRLVLILKELHYELELVVGYGGGLGLRLGLRLLRLLLSVTIHSKLTGVLHHVELLVVVLSLTNKVVICLWTPRSRCRSRGIEHRHWLVRKIGHVIVLLLLLLHIRHTALYEAVRLTIDLLHGWQPTMRSLMLVSSKV